MSNQFSGKTVIISGGAGGIGLALATELGQLGMKVVIADIDPDQLKLAEQQLKSAKVEVLACPLDVTDASQWQAVHDASLKAFGHIHMLINNAGVAGVPGTVDETKLDTWKWVLDVNVMGVVNGTQTIAPTLKAQKQGGWIINVASMAGMNGVAYSGAYAASKAAVVSMTESWAQELQKHNILVSVLCPAFVKTRIHQSLRNLQPKYQAVKTQGASQANPKQGLNQAAALVEAGIPAEMLAKRVVEALESKQSYIFTHPNYKAGVAYRSKLLDQAFADAEQSTIVGHLIDQPIDIL
ncbi:SDR family NAD(P)-dependent oxidoreductase [Paraglaciecola aestuariivivens]